MLIEYIMTGSRQDPIYRQVSPSNQVVWSLDYAKLVTPPSGATGDWCHANAITVDLVKNVVYANCRWAGLLKTTYASTPVRQWLLTGMAKGASVPTLPPSDIAFSPTSSAFSDTHDPEIHDDGTICFFDNGGYSGGAGGSTTMFHSRAVEYQINETAKTATLVWEFPGNATVPDAWYTANWYTPFWGDVDRLPNGNHLIAAGIRAPPVESRVFEVTKDDRKVVWEFRFPADYGVYRADRITPPLHPRGHAVAPTAAAEAQNRSPSLVSWSKLVFSQTFTRCRSMRVKALGAVRGSVDRGPEAGVEAIDLLHERAVKLGQLDDRGAQALRPCANVGERSNSEKSFPRPRFLTMQ